MAIEATAPKAVWPGFPAAAPREGESPINVLAGGGVLQ